MRPAPDNDIDRAVEVVNTWDTLRPDPEQIEDLEVLRRFLRWIGRPDEAARLQEGDLDRFRELRSRLRSALAAGTEAAAVAGLNAILAGAPARASLQQIGSGWGFRFDGADASDALSFLAPLCSIALLSAIRDLGWGRLGVCAGTPCTCLFVDRTRNRARRYCSDQCNDRVAQAARRRRAAS
jgi:predicted RNA-binding Zn ribbon-like protein